MGRPQSAWAKFRLLMWKNWTLQKRHKVQAVLEVLLPLVFTSLLVLIRSLADATVFPDPTLYDPMTVDRLPNASLTTTRGLDPAKLLQLFRGLQLGDEPDFSNRFPFSTPLPSLSAPFPFSTPFPIPIPDDIKECFKDLLSGPLFASLATSALVNETGKWIGFTPNNTFATSVMGAVQARLGGFLKLRVEGFATEKEMLEALDPPTGLSVNNRIAGVVLPDIGDISELNGVLTFKIRPRIPTEVTAFQPPSVWYTSLQFPPFQMLGPRNKGDNDGGSPGYYEHGFLALQHAVSAVLTERLSGRRVSEPAFAQRVPYPAYVDDQFLVVLQGWLPLVIMLSFIYPAINIVKNVVVEKEKRLKESMKMMGMPNWIHWMAWWAKSFIQLFVSIVIMTILLMVDWYSGPEGEAVLSQSDPSVIFVYLLLFAINSIAFCFMVSTWFSKANSAATAAGVLFFVLFIPYNFLYLTYQTLGLGAKIGSCLMSNTAMGFGGMLISMWEGTANTASTMAGLLWFATDIPYRVMWRRLNRLTFGQKLLCCMSSNTNMGMGGAIIAQYESTGEGIQWSNVNRGVSPDDEFRMSHVFMMFVVDTILYLVIAWYVEAVFPGEYGIAQPWYFLFTKRYWVGSHPREDGTVAVNNNSERADFFEPEPTGSKAGIRIEHLSKKFSNGKLAVNNVSLNMYEGQITALLGHNGAGKTTTMSVLVGLFPASSGTALINGYDIGTEVDEVRASLGICPQHDVLFDELTVAEHIRFFCMLKGFDGDYREEIDKMLNVLQLEDKRNAQSRTLSGGMKRKLSVGVALCGDSKVVLLDEPTSGMDPSARRSTWDLLQRERSGRTMLLTTHFMEEADLLGDRIAIMADGQLQCCGSSLFLKRKYGAGYHMVIVKEEGCNVDKITNTIQRFIPDISFDQNIGAELSYVLPNEASARFEEMFTELDERREELKVSSYGASITTMEEVFIRVGEQSNPKVQEELKQRSGATNGSAPRQTTPHGHVNGAFLPDVEVASPGGTSNIHPTLANIGTVRYMEEEEIEMVHRITIEKVPQERRNTSGVTLFIQQFYAMLVKKAIHSIRNWVLTLVQIFLPIFFLSMALLVIMSFPGLADDPPLELKLTNYDGTNTPVWSEPGVPRADEIAASVATIENTIVELINVTKYGNMTQYLLEKSNENIPGFNQHYIAAVDLVSDGGSGLAATAIFNNQPFHSAGVAMKVLDEALLRYYTNDSSLRISVTNHPTPISDQTKLQMQLNGQSNGFNIAFNVAFGVSFLAASFVLFLVKEMATKAKHLQFVSGVGITVFWLSNLVWDYVSYLIPACGMLLTLLAFQEEGFIEPQTQGTLLLLFVMYGYAMLPQTYLFSFAFTVPSSGFTRVALFNIFTGMATMVTVSVMRIPLLDLIDVADILDWIFLVLPNYALGMGMADIYSNYQGILYCNALPCREKFCELLNVINSTNPCCKELGNCGESGCVYFTDNYLSLERLGIGRTLLFLFAEGTICLIILCLIELRVADKIKYFINNKRNTYGKLMELSDAAKEENMIVAEVDSDVAAEKKRIQTADMSELKENNVLVVKDLTKFYSKSFLAVDRLCLAVPKGECFGLLGINGAGKTTTFKMLTGDELISWGDAFLMGRSVRDDVKEVHKRLGYCPQFDAVIDQMTGRETIRMFARLRGVVEADIDNVIDRLAHGLFLTEHIDKQVREYSGGNKRKLSTAVALVGDPPIVFLDEPTTGMDPVARRLLWDVICRIRAAGRSIILTSHSMEECEALCTRLAIMVNGQFKCMGSPQHLKSKFGQGYTLLIKVNISAEEKEEFSKTHKRATSSSSVRRQMSASVNPMKRRQSIHSSVQPVKDFVEKNFPGSILKDVHQGLLNYQITDTAISWARIFGMMERAKEGLHIEDYSVGQTTLEQVFLNFAKGQRTDED